MQNRLRVRYDPARVTPELLLQTIDRKGYPGKIVSDGGR